jgi:hypothetical protein
MHRRASTASRTRARRVATAAAPATSSVGELTSLKARAPAGGPVSRPLRGEQALGELAPVEDELSDRAIKTAILLHHDLLPLLGS